jgi:uncharacterized protein (TIRG00374 family)
VRNQRNWIIGIVISGVALLIAFWGINPSRFWSALSGAAYLLVLPVAGLMVIGLFARARSWNILLKGSVSWYRSFEALNEGYLLNNVLPLRLGELARAYLVTKGGAISMGASTATVLLERLIDAAVSLLGLLLALPFVVRSDWVVYSAALAGVIIVVGILGVVIVSRSPKATAAMIAKLPLPGLKHLASNFMSGLEGVLQLRILAGATFWSLIAWVTTWEQIFIIMSMFGIRESFLALPFISGIVAFGAAIPSSPGAIGVFELSTVAGLTALGHAREDGLGVAIIWHGIQVVMTSIFGSMALAKEGDTLSELAQKVRTRLSP